MFCYKCRANVSDDSLYCHNCGSNLLKGIGEDTESEVTKDLKIDDNSDLKVGEQFGDRYKIIEELGRGGMGRVYKAEDRVLGAIVALKIIRPEYLSDNRMIERFKKEILLAREITNENVVRIHDFGEEKGIKFITMNYIEGKSLKETITDEGPLKFKRVLAIAKDVCKGLKAAHKKGIIHRDLKPQNIMMGENDHIYITDFGLAKSIEGTSISQTGLAIGTPQYIAPEQWKGEDADKRSDIYTLGIVLFEMVTGRSLFTADTDLGYLQKHLNEKPVLPSELKDELPLYFRKVILKCLEKERELRYQSVEELLKDIEEGFFVSTPFLKRVKHLRVKHIKLSPVVTIAALIFSVVLLLKLFVPGTSDTDMMKKRTVAILSFKNMSGLKELGHLSNSLSDLLITDLGQSKFIKVMPEAKLFKILNTTNYIKDNNLNAAVIEDINKRGNVNYLIHGSFIQSGKKLRINVKLLDSETGELVDSSSADTETDNIFPAVDRLTRELKRSFKLTDNEIFEDIDTNIENITTSSQEALKYYVEGKRQFNLSHYDESIKNLKKAVRIDPEFAIAYRAMAWTYAYMYNWDKRKEYFEKTIKHVDKLSEKEKLQIYGAYSGEKEITYQQSIDSYKKLLEIYPDNFEANIQLGMFYRMFEEWNNGIKYLNNALKEDISNIYVAEELVNCYAGKGDYKKADEILVEYEKNNPDLNKVIVLKIKYQNYILQKKFDLASMMIDELSNSNKRHTSDVFYNKCQINLLNNNYKKSFDVFNNIVLEKKLKKNWPTVNQLKFLFLYQGKFSKFRKLLNEEIEDSNEFFANTLERKWEMFDILLKTGSPDEVLNRIKTLNISEDTEYPSHFEYKLFYKAFAEIELEDLKTAEKTINELKGYVDKSIFTKSSNRRYNYLLGKLEEKRKNYKKAEEFYLRGMEYFSSEFRPYSYSRYYYSIANLYYISGQFSKAEEWFDKIQKLTKGRYYNGDLFVRSFYYLGKIYQKKGWIGKAIEAYEKFCYLWKDGDSEITGKYIIEIQSILNKLKQVSN
ncbi:MAG: FlgO family outer membrane protein [Acidobacteriota bacterium]